MLQNTTLKNTNVVMELPKVKTEVVKKKLIIYNLPLAKVKKV